MIDYRNEGHAYTISYQELREHYHKFVTLSDHDFLEELPKAIHFACVVCWFKEVGAEASISDRGIIHELAHLLDCGTTTPLQEIREQFKKILYLD